MNPQLTNWSDSLVASLYAALSLLFAAVLRVLGFLVILAIGWLVASVIEKVLMAVLRALRVDGFTASAGLGGMLRTLRREPSALLGALAKWFVRLITLVAAFDALGVPAVAEVFHHLLLWLPNLAVALVVLGIGGVAANWLGDTVRSGALSARLGQHEALGAAARWSVWAFALLVAINQIGVARALVDILFTAVVGAIALALGLSFGLGGRDTAAIIVRKVYERSRRTGALGQVPGSANAPPSVGTDMLYRGVEHCQAGTDRRNGHESRQPG
jgi:hypothetical protein